MISVKKYILYISVFLILTGLLAEGILRFVRYPSLQYFRDLKIIHTYHPDYNVGLSPDEDVYLRHNLGYWEGRFTTNSFGHRGSPEPAADQPQLVCLGDSVVMGFGVSDDETFCSRLDQKSGYRAINLGVDAFGSLGSARRLKEAAGQFRIDLALFFLSPNDFTMAEDLRSRGVLSDDEQDDFRLNDPFFKKTFRMQFELTRWSYLLMAARLSYDQIRIKIQETKAGILSEFRSLIGNPGNYLVRSFYSGPHIHHRNSNADTSQNKPSLADPSEVMCPVPIPQGYNCEDQAPEPESLPELLPATKAAYDQMAEISKKYNFPVVLVLLPVQLNDLHCLSHNKYSAKSEYMMRAAAYFRKKGMPVMDLRPYVKKMCGRRFIREKDRLRSGYGYTTPDDHIIPLDGHFTYEGNLWAAEAILDYMNRNGGSF